MDAQIRRQRTFEALKKLFLRESLNQPLLFIFEDLHWIDSETQGFLDALSESIALANLLLLVNYRPEYRHEWGQKTYCAQLRLAPLGKDEAEELLTSLLGRDASLKALKGLILERTDGTPFFMEEVVQTLTEEGALSGERSNYRLEATPTELHISPTVQGVLAARIDRLTAEEKEFLQQLSVIGRQFPVSLVKQVVPQSEADLYRILASLQAKEFLYEQPAFPEVEYLFKHALTQDVAYGTVLQERRKALHERTGQAIESLYKDKREDHYTELAHHYSLSDNTEKALEYLYLAGQRAIQRSANAEAIEHLNQGIALLQTLPDSSERTQHELQFHVALNAPLYATSGFASPELGQTMEQAYALCQRLGEPPELFSVLTGLWMFHTGGQSALETGRALAEQMLRLAQQQDDATLVQRAHAWMANTLFYLSDLSATRKHLEQAIALDDIVPDGIIDQMGLDQKGVLHLIAALTLWVQGYPEQASQQNTEVLTRAQELSHPNNLAQVLTLAALFHVLRREVQPTLENTEAARILAIERGLPFYLAWGSIHQGWAVADQGDPEQGVSLLEQGLSHYRATGQGGWVPFYLGLLAQVQGQAGHMEEGLSILAKAREMSTQRGEVWSEAELYRLTGELTLQEWKVKGHKSKVEEEAEGH